MRDTFFPSSEIAAKFWIGISKVVGALLVFLIGWIIAKFAKILIIKFFKLIRIDTLAEDSGLKELLEKGGVSRSVSDLLGVGVYWLLMLVVIFMAINFAGIIIPPTVIDSLLTFIPKFILGLLIFIFSLFVATLFAGIVRTSAANAGIERAGLLGKFTQIAIITFGIVLSLQEIEIAPNFIGNVFIIILGSFCFGMALAFALGAKDIVRKHLEAFLEQKPENKTEQKP